MTAPKTVNASLHRARRAKNDEFYTQVSDIQNEVGRYLNAGRNPFKGKTVLMNCDDPGWSNFWKYFARQFDHLKIGRLIATHYEPDGSPSYAMFLERDADGHMIDLGTDEHGTPRGRVQPLEGDGDFRSPECVALLEESDIVVTNPPFSLFREYVAQLIEHEKQFLVLGNPNAVTFKEIFPLFKDGRVWWGVKSSGGTNMFFRASPEKTAEVVSSKPEGSWWRMIDGIPMVGIKTVWFTNMDHLKRHEELILVRHYEGNEGAYPRYDNYDAINVDKVVEIPGDYEGVMGVPITFLDKYNPDQFEIVRFRHGDDGLDLRVNGRTPYFRIAIRNRKPQPKIDYATERAA